jgi:hypothetical protein
VGDFGEITRRESLRMISEKSPDVKPEDDFGEITRRESLRMISEKSADVKA